MKIKMPVKTKNAYKVMKGPVSPRTVRRWRAAHPEHLFVGVIGVDMADLIDFEGIDGLNDYANERMLKDGILEDISYAVVGHDGDIIHIEVSAKVYGGEDGY